MFAWVVPREIVEISVPADPIGRTDKRKPVRHGTVRRSRRKTVRVPHDPGSENPTT